MPLVVTGRLSSNKQEASSGTVSDIASSNKCLTSSNKIATLKQGILVGTSALLVVTRSY